TGNHVWADRYDGDLSDIFALQDEITHKVVAAIEPKLLEAEAMRSQNRSPEDLGAWEMIMHANSLFWRLNKPDGEAAIAMLRRAVTQYPDYGPAHSMLAFMLLISGRLAWTSAELEAQVPEAQKLATKAMSLDSNDPWAHLALGFVAYTKRSTDEAVEEFTRARPQSELCCRPWVSRVGASAGRPIQGGNFARRAGHSHEPARSANGTIQCSSCRRPLPRRAF